ncbi:MAG: GNAT family N-acetyltransferase [Methanothrix sp.]|jgi:D-alanine-D-alanine ligase|uniref:D-alanine--D-alanine ligase n=1 Tax=Methanothrix harundinacea TaxID=301375 RepID=A0A101FUB0_9EURY|nr:MAG: D-alanine--D-alanine ligase [Methanothrix harundinacea]MDD2637477.1 GNAT family N-acetyltransferase [Methanothrix sp.]MDI9400015.1 GNAT family N-acetyltransferase [Euryarchaeota archaeon]KUK95835.1 MAG: D-alanine--D-alanine ligase [Methanothrix harundinacea]MCP1393223.1 GNAT family N-acetyltransferase [Methanothrix harundinacea]
MKVAILYNIPGEGSARSKTEMTAEIEVLETVTAAKRSLEERGIEAVPLQCSLEALFSLKNFDLVFNLAEGFGDDLRAEPNVAGFIELLGVPYTGSPPRALEVARDKGLSKLILEREGISTPRFQLFRTPDEPFSLDFPVIVKPALEDASIGITFDSIARDETNLRAKVARILETYDQPALVEEYVEGREVNAALFIGPYGAEVLPISEIVFNLPDDVPRILGFEAKWLEESPFFQNTIPICPAPLEPELKDRIEILAKEACSALGIESYARVDFRIREGDDEPFVIEVNPNPCINPSGSGFARAAAAAGMDYPTLIERLARSALDRFRKGHLWTEAGSKDGKEGMEGDDEGFSAGELGFRRVRAKDAPLLFRWFEDRELTRYMEPSSSLTIDQLEVSILCSKDEDFVIYWGDAAIGFASLYDRTPCTCEISYLIGDPDYRGRGLGRKIVDALLDHGFSRLGLKSIFASATVENLSSIRALEGAGFRRIGTRRDCSRLGEFCLDDILFDITKEEHLARRSGCY